MTPDARSERPLRKATGSGNPVFLVSGDLLEGRAGEQRWPVGLGSPAMGRASALPRASGRRWQAGQR